MSKKKKQKPIIQIFVEMRKELTDVIDKAMEEVLKKEILNRRNNGKSKI